MVYVPVQGPYFQSTEIIKAGRQASGVQRYQYQNKQCTRRIFLLQYQDRGRVPDIPARWSTWYLMAAASAILPACCGLVP